MIRYRMCSLGKIRQTVQITIDYINRYIVVYKVIFINTTFPSLSGGAPNKQNYLLLKELIYMLYTMSKKGSRLMFDNNFGKCGPIFKIISPSDSRINSLRIDTKISTSPAICCYITL